MSVRVRYAPSPTGDLHLGSLRTVIFDYLVARQNAGTFMIRIEDTDQARTVPGAVERQLEALRWMGIEPDEGVCLDEQGAVIERGNLGPYTQSNRLATYQKYVDELLQSRSAYRCFCTPERLEQMRAEQQASHLPPRYDQRCRSISKEESAARAANGEKFVVRHAIPAGVEVRFNDVIRGEVSFKSDDLDDYVLLKSDGFPTYQLANVVDDHLMEISHVLRGEEWLPSLPKNLLLYQSFGWEAPQFAHLPVILGPDGKHKLSKRDGDVSVIDYKSKGYLPDALFNMLAFIGWSPGTEEEFFTREELAKRFRLEKVQKAPAAFSFDRLDYVNGWYIRQLQLGELAEHMLPYLIEAGLVKSADGKPPYVPVHEIAFWQDSFGQYLLDAFATLQERIKHFDETVELSRFFFERPAVTDELKNLIVPKKGELATTLKILGEVTEMLAGHGDWSKEGLEDVLRRFIDENGYKSGEVLWPIRAALSGLPASPGTFELLAVFGKDESLLRLRAVLV